MRTRLTFTPLESREVPIASAAFSVDSNWGSGLQAAIQISNPDPAPVSNWQLAFEYAANITSIWDGQIVSHVGNNYVVRHNGWNSTLAAGGTVSFGFVASPGGTAVPGNYVLNGVPLNGAPVPPAAGTDSVTTVMNTPVTINVLANDSNPAGGPLTILRANFQTSRLGDFTGKVRINPDSTLTLTPPRNYLGSGTITYVIRNSAGLEATGTVNVNVVTAPTTVVSAWPSKVFAPFVDMGLYPTYNLVNAAQTQNVKYFNLGFITADPQGRPAWGGYAEYAVNGSSFDMAVRSQLAQVRALGGNAAVSFGGASGQELAQVITDVTALTAAYQQVIDAYGLTRIDFDIEGAAAAQPASIQRRSQAIRNLQLAAQAANRELQVWLTLPVLPSGLTVDGLNVVNSARSAGVILKGVNIMAMDFGDSAAPNPNGLMGQYVIQSGASVINQLQAVYGASLTAAQIRKMIGLTPMIGMNDVTTEVFRQSDAQQVLAWAQQQNIGMLSFWSLNRDRQHPSGAINYVDLTSSSILQQPFEFSQIFHPFTG